MSATINCKEFADYFAVPVQNRLSPACVFEVPGQPHAIEEHYLDDLEHVPLGRVGPGGRLVWGSCEGDARTRTECWRVGPRCPGTRLCARTSRRCCERLRPAPVGSRKDLSAPAGRTAGGPRAPVRTHPIPPASP